MQTFGPPKYALPLLCLSSLILALCGCGALTPSNTSSTGSSGSGSSGTGGTQASLTSINHIIFLAQENRSLDHYFGALRHYWAQNGYPDQSFDGLPQFNPATGASPLAGPAPSNPGCNPTSRRLPIALTTPAIQSLLTT